MNDQIPEERFDEFLKENAERWRAHEAEVAAAKAAFLLLVDPQNVGPRLVSAIEQRLREVEAKLDPEAHPAGRELLKSLRMQIQASKQGWVMDGRLPGNSMS